MAICPLLSIINMKAEKEDSKQEYVECQEEKCQWYIRKSARTEVFDCAITALATYNLPHYRHEDRY